MAEQSIYKDIAERTGGDIYIGVVGPVRSGKSTFITRFMQELVLPNIKDDYDRKRTVDEMPQSAQGKTVMTTEPKFVPDEAVSISLDGGAQLRVKMIDCVGFMIPEALGAEEGGETRMVNTPWQKEPMPFARAAEIGTRRVIGEHATIGMLVSSDGTVGEIPRESYLEAEERTVAELKAMGKPFALVLNSADPARARSRELALSLEEKYGVPVALVNCLTLSAEDIRGILRMVLGEFPVSTVKITLPAWARALEPTHPIRHSVTEDICRIAARVRRMDEVGDAFAELSQNECIEHVQIDRLDMGSGTAQIVLDFAPALYYNVLSEIAGCEICEEGALFSLLRELCEAKKRYDRISEALEMADARGYGIVMPEAEDLHLEQPTVVKQAGGYGVRLRASAQSIHMIRANIEAEINPIVGTEQQSQEFMRGLLSELEQDPQKIWQSNMFGKSLYEMVNEGLHQKLTHMPDEARAKIAETLERIINEGSNGLICILL